MKFAIIEDNFVVNVVVAEGPLADNWIELPDGVGKGWTYDGETFTAPDPEPTPEVEKTLVITKDSPFMTLLKDALNLTEQQVDDLFQ